MVKKTIVFCALFCALCPLAVFAESEELKPFAMTDTRAYGMGGPHVAYTDDVFSLFVNPAALLRTNQRSIVELGVGIYGPSVELLSIVNKTPSGDPLVESLEKFVDASGGNIPLGAGIRGPLAIGYVANGLGFGIWDRIYADIKLTGTDVDASIAVDAILNFGMAFNIFTFGKHTLDAGFVTKIVSRTKTGIDENLFEFTDSGKASSFFDNLTVPLLLGAGLDLGVTYRWRILAGNVFSAAIVADDLPTLVGKMGAVYGKGDIPSRYVIYPRVNIGTAYAVDFSEFSSVPIRLAGALDYYDISRWFTPNDFTKRNPILNLSVGLEATFFKMFSLRAGLNDMLPAVGFGFAFNGFRIDGAMYGKELGVEPGQLSTYAFDLSLSFRPGSKERKWAWTKPIFVREDPSDYAS
jgi:hypothetical protein